MVSEHRYIAVAGNMGVGKSTMVQFLTTQFGGEAFYEPVDTNPFFKHFFKDMRTWAFHSQIYFLTHKFRIHQEVQGRSGLTVIDRTIYEDAEIFARGLHQDGMMSDDEFNLYWDLYESMCQTLRPPDFLIYLTCSMATLRERIATRGRPSEKHVKIEYLKTLQRRYDLWVKNIKFCKVVHIHTDNLDYISDLVHRASVINQLAKHL